MILGNARVITLNKETPFLENGAVYILKNKIVDFGKTDEILKKYPNEEFIDLEEKLLMPGFINPHHHIYSAFARGMASNEKPPLNFLEILERVWWKLDKKLNLDEIEYSALTTYIECIKNGVTTVFDHHASPYSIKNSLETIAKAAKKIGIRSCLCYEVSDRDGEQIANDGIEENMNFIKKYNTDDQNMIKGMFGLHASFTLSNKTLEKCKKAIDGYDVGYHVHVAEGKEDLDECLKKHGERVVERLDKYGIFNKKTIAVHCIHIDKNELEILKKREASVVHNPESNMGNAVGCASILEIYKKGINLGLGTDGFTSDILESMKVGNILHKHENKNPSVGFQEICSMALEKNRKIAELYFKGELGVIKKDALADLIVLDYNPLTPLTESNYCGHMIFGMSGRDTVSVVIDGKFIMRDRKILTVNEKEILKTSREISKKLWEK